MKKNKKTHGIHFPEDEKKLPWLSMLLHAYHVTDNGIKEALRREMVKGRKLACSPGCSVCCRMETDIPIFPLEIVGITWFAIEKIQGDLRVNLLNNLKNHLKGNPCPFLIGHQCSVYAMRPMACRQYNVFQLPCQEGEDAFYSRKEDVLIPIRQYTDESFFLTLPFYGVNEPEKRRTLIRNGGHHSLAKVLQQIDWKNLGYKLESLHEAP